MKNVQKIVFLSLLAAFCLSSNIFAQAETEIVIVKKMIDENGVETEEKITLTGEEAEKYIQDQNIKITEKSTGNGEVEMTLELTAEKGEHEEMNIWISKEGDETKIKSNDKLIFVDTEGKEIPEDVRQMLIENGIDIDELIKEHGSHDKEGGNKIQLGVMIEDGSNGVVVVDLVEGSAAKAAGVMKNDIITYVDKTKINKADELINALADKVLGEHVVLTVFRKGELEKINVTLQASQENATKEYRTEHKVLKIKGGDINKCDPNEIIQNRTESLTDEEIEIVEETIIEQTGQQVEVRSGPNTLEISELDLFPNPTDGNIRVRFSIENQQETNVKILDLSGRSVYEKNIQNFDGIFDEQIELPRDQLGTLVLVIAQGKNVFTEKIILN